MDDLIVGIWGSMNITDISGENVMFCYALEEQFRLTCYLPFFLVIMNLVNHMYRRWTAEYWTWTLQKPIRIKLMKDIMKIQKVENWNDMEVNLNDHITLRGGWIMIIRACLFGFCFLLLFSIPFVKYLIVFIPRILGFVPCWCPVRKLSFLQ